MVSNALDDGYQEAEISTSGLCPSLMENHS